MERYAVGRIMPVAASYCATYSPHVHNRLGRRRNPCRTIEGMLLTLLFEIVADKEVTILADTSRGCKEIRVHGVG